MSIFTQIRFYYERTNHRYFMEHLICIVPVMPLRAEPSDRSEMISQLLFGEAAVVLEKGTKGWIRIRNQFDRYEGWASINQMTGIEEELYQEPTEEYTSELITTVSVSGHPMNLPLGSFLKGMRHGEMQWSKVHILYKGDPLKPDHKELTEKKIRDVAYKYLNTPYLWGGRSNYGIDCSGFIQSVFRLLGKTLPRDAGEQAACGEVLKEGIALRCGDLAFFESEEKKITHVGLILNHFEVIHSSGKVRVDKLDKVGIQNADTGDYTHKLSMIRRIY